MDKSLREHITALEQRQGALSSKLMEESDLDRRNNLESELRAVQTALRHYRAALELEGSIQGR